MKLDIVSGFLGSGKTTWIQKCMKELYHNEKILIIENEFGEISIDATILRANGYELRELNSGCICCNISGDFESSLREIVNTIKVDRIVIEPSGIANLSDILQICEKYVEIDRKFVIVDAVKFHLYLRNFEHFFKDQIQNGNIIVLSRINDKVNLDSILSDLRLLNNNAIFIATIWNEFEIDKLEVKKGETKPYIKSKIPFFNRVFYFDKSISVEKFNFILERIKLKKYLRAKGVVLLENRKWMHFEYAGDEMKIEEFESQSVSSFVIIDDKEVEDEGQLFSC